MSGVTHPMKELTSKISLGSDLSDVMINSVYSGLRSPMRSPLVSFAMGSARPLGQAFLVPICAIMGLQ